MSKDHVDPEEEYFHREEKEKLAKLRAQAEAEQAAAALVARRELHWHKCGKCGADMASKIFKGVEIEVCGECGAVLLDNGELEKVAGADAKGAIDVLSDLFRFSKKNRDFKPDDDRLS